MAEMTKAFCVYVHMKPDLTPFYVGKGTLDRATTLGAKGRRNKWHLATVKKYGKENVIVEIQECATEAEAFFREKLVIASLRSSGCSLCNMTDGGEGSAGYKLTDEQRKRRSEYMKAHPEMWQPILGWKHSASDSEIEAHRKKLAVVASGRKHSDETKAKLSAIKRNPTDEVRARMSEAQKGKTLSDEHKAKLAASARNCSEDKRKKLSEAGRRVSEETRKKRAESMRASVAQRREAGLIPPGRRYLAAIKVSRALIEAQDIARAAEEDPVVNDCAITTLMLNQLQTDIENQPGYTKE